MKTIKFTQYLLPDGRTKEVFIDVEDEIGEKAEKFIEDGGKFEIEMLTTGDISMTAVWRDEDISIEVVKNGPEVISAVDNLIKSIKI